MSSNDHKKFKTEATQKTSTDTEVISDTVLLPPYSTDHVLTVTAPSSTAGLTGQVDVELEMSPDGENWCPAQTETITAGSGGTATGGVSAEDANLNAVSTLPDPNSATSTYTYTGNKFALGSKSYDDSGNEIDINNPNGGTKDFMHQLMSKDKPFNYSLWLKTKTDTQPFADDYTPVIFRHGGKDKFTNLKTVELTDSGTQNLAEGIVSNELAIRKDNIIDYKINYELKGTNKNLFNNNNNMPSIEDPFTISFTGFLHSNSFFDTIIGQHAVGTRDHFKIFYLSGDLTISFAGGGAVNDIKCSAASIDQVFSHIVIVKEQGLPSTSTVKFYINGVLQTTAQGYSSGTLSTTAWNNLYVGQVSLHSASRSFSVNSTFAGTASRTSGNRDTTDQIACFSKALSDINPGDNPISAGDTAGGEIATLYNSGNYHDLLNLASSFDLKKYFKCGDGPNDNKLGQVVKAYDVVNNAEYIESVSANPSEYYEYISNPSNLPSNYRARGGLSQDIFTTTSNLSISGWFKTTDTGILFSNSSDGTNGLLFDIQSSVYQLKFGSVATIQSASSGIRDGQWHNLVITKAAKDGSNLSETKIYIDGSLASTTSVGSTLANSDLRGSNAFTLLSNGENNTHVSSPASTDTSKLQATLSNWSIHSEVLSANAVKQIYSNGHVRNIKNLPAIDSNEIKAWWKLSDTTTPEEDSAGSNDLQYTGFYGARDKAIKADGDGTNPSSNGLQLTASANRNPIGATTSDTTLDLTNGLGISMNIKCEGSVTVSSQFSRKNLFSIRLTNGRVLEVIFEKSPATNDLALVLYISNTTQFGGSSTSANYINFPLGTGLDDGNWHHLSINVTANSSSISSTARIYLDGNLQSWVNNFWTGGSPSTFSAFVSGMNILGNNLLAGNTNNLDMDVTIDNLGFFTGYPNNTDFDSTAATDIYNNRNNLSNSSSDFRSIFLMGDGANDVITPNSSISIEDTISTDRVITPQTNFHANSGVITLTSSEDPYYNIPTTDLTTEVVPATGETLIVEEDQYGSGVTMSLTKRFNTTTNEWTNVHTNETCVCLSFNGFEDQAEYFAIYTHDTINVADNAWHNLALSFSGREGGATTSTTNFSFDTTSHNFVLSIDGSPITGAHFVGGLAGIPIGKSFTAQERHLKWDNNSEEDYIPHAQLNSNIFESINQTNQLHEPVKDRDYKTGFVGYADESSFHSESWFTDSSFNPQAGFNDQKVKTLYGSTGTTLSNRGAGSSFPVGTPYPLRRPSVIGSSTSTGNQYIDPDRYNASTNADGGLEAWWRWGDTIGDCSVNINDAIGFESGGTDTRRSLKLNGTYNSEENSVTGLLEDLFPLTSSDSIYVPEAAASSGGGGISLVNVIIENVQAGVCNLKNLTSPILQYIRVKFTNSGEAQLGEGKLEATVHYRKRRER